MTMANLPAILGGEPVRSQGPPHWPPPDPAITRLFSELAQTGDWGRYTSRYVEELRGRLSALHACEHVVLCGSGTSAVELALRGAGVRPGDEVVMAAYDFKANFTNITLLGARPVLVDIDRSTGQLDLDQVPQALTSRPRAMIVSHLHGGLVDMRRLTAFAADAGVAVIEDACQVSSAAVFQGKAAGTWGDVGVLSFGGSKLLTAGRGGAVLTNRGDIAQRIKLYSQRGNEAYPLSELQAAVLLPQFDALTDRQQLRQAAVLTILRGLSPSGGLSAFLPLNPGDPTLFPEFYKLGFWYDTERFEGLSRERFCEAMRAEGIPVDPGFRGLHLIHARSRFRPVGELTEAGRADESVVVLHHPLLLDGAQAGRDFLTALDKVASHARMIAAIK